MSTNPRSGPETTVPLPVSEPEVLEETKTRSERPWNVVVWDDPVNLMSYVVWVFQRVFGFDRHKATVKMREVHFQGRSIVASTEREEAEMYVTRLHSYGLQATMERAEGEA